MQRLTGRLHQQLVDIVVPRILGVRKADPEVETWDDAIERIAGAYGEAAGIGAKALSDYGFTYDEATLGKMDAAVAAAVSKASNYVHRNLGNYGDQLRLQLDHEDIDYGDAVHNLSSRLELYAEPVWNVFQNVKRIGYEDQGGGLLLIWSLDPASNHCDDCPEIADGNPYTTSAGDNPLPTWPGDGDTQCETRCNCSVEPEEQSWNDIMAPVEEQANADAEQAAESFT